jgi:hypothetical protein
VRLATAARRRAFARRVARARHESRRIIMKLILIARDRCGPII